MAEGLDSLGMIHALGMGMQFHGGKPGLKFYLIR